MKSILLIIICILFLRETICYSQKQFRCVSIGYRSHYALENKEIFSHDVTVFFGIESKKKSITGVNLDIGKNAIQTNIQNNMVDIWLFHRRLVAIGNYMLVYPQINVDLMVMTIRYSYLNYETRESNSIPSAGFGLGIMLLIPETTIYIDFSTTIQAISVSSNEFGKNRNDFYFFNFMVPGILIGIRY
jgi:hypothetical protein